MNNPYQLTGYTANGKSTLLGTFETRGQAVEYISTRKSDPLNVYIEFRIAGMCQYQVAYFDEKMQLEVIAGYRTKAQAEQAYQALKADYAKVEISHIGGISND